MAGERCITSAVSSTESPAKKRSSTIIEGAQPLQRVVQTHQIEFALPGHGHRLVEFDFHGARTALPRLLGAGVIHEDTANHLRRDAIEVGTVAPVDVPLIDQAQERFMDQRRALQRVIGALPAQMRARQTAQFAIDKGHQFVERALVAVAPVDQQRGQLRGGFRFRHPRLLSQGENILIPFLENPRV